MRLLPGRPGGQTSVAPVEKTGPPKKSAMKCGQTINVQQLLDDLTDLDGDGTVDDKDRKLREMVEAMDSDGNGTIDAMEMIKFVQARLANDKKRRNAKRMFIGVGVVTMLVVALSLAAAVASIEMTKEARSQGGVMVDARSGEPVKNAPLTTGDRMVDSSGSTIATKRATKSSVLSSHMKLEELRLLTSIELPVEGANGLTEMVRFVINGFYQSGDGNLLELYTPGDSMVTVSGEEIFVAQSRPGSGKVTFLPVVPPSVRRRTRRRQLLQAGPGSGGGPDATTTQDCGSGNCDDQDPCPETAVYDASTGTCACAVGMEAVSGSIEQDGCKCSGVNQYAAYNIFQGKFSLCYACGAGSTVAQSRTRCDCPIAVWHPATNTCDNCPPGRVLTMKPWGWECDCPACEIGVMWGGSVVACVPCTDGFVLVTDSSGAKRCVTENWPSSGLGGPDWEQVDCLDDPQPTPDGDGDYDTPEPTLGFSFGF